MTIRAHEPLQNSPLRQAGEGNKFVPCPTPPPLRWGGVRRRRDRCSRPRRRGIVLILVTVVIVMVSLAGLSFVLNLTAEHKAVDLHGDELRLQQLLESGVELMATMAEQSPELQRAAGGAQDNPDLFRGGLVIDDDRAARHGRVTVISPRLDHDEVVGVRYGWEDESAG